MCRSFFPAARPHQANTLKQLAEEHDKHADGAQVDLQGWQSVCSGLTESVEATRVGDIEEQLQGRWMQAGIKEESIEQEGRRVCWIENSLAGLTSPADASAVPRAMKDTDSTSGRVGVSRRATNRETMVMMGVNACTCAK